MPGLVITLKVGQSFTLVDPTTGRSVGKVVLTESGKSRGKVRIESEGLRVTRGNEPGFSRNPRRA